MSGSHCCGEASRLRLVHARRETRKVKGANRNAALRLTAHHGADLEADKSQHQQQDRRAECYNLCIVGHPASLPLARGYPKLSPPIVKEKWHRRWRAFQMAGNARVWSIANASRGGGITGRGTGMNFYSLTQAEDEDAKAIYFLALVRPRGLEPPRVSPLAPQASASTNSAMAAEGR
jgi:hypothetical protein